MSYDVDSIANSKQSEDEKKTLKDWIQEFQLDYQAHKQWCDEKKTWEEFYDGEQLSAEEKNKLKERGQPEVVINQIKPFIDGVIGDFFGRRVMMRARDKGSLDFDVAKHITEALRYIEERNRFDEVEADVAKQLLISGVGWYKVGIEFDFSEPEIIISFRQNDDIVVDRKCRQRDLSDAKRIYETVWADVDDLVELYPMYEKEIRDAVTAQNQNFANSFSGGQSYLGDDYAQSDKGYTDANFDLDMSMFSDSKRKTIRIINIWERERELVEFAYHPDLPNGGILDITEMGKDERATMKQTHPDYQIFTRLKTKLNTAIFICNKILEYKKNVRPHDSEGKFPLFRSMAQVTHGPRKMPYGMVKQYIDPQKEYNKRRSKLLHKSNTARVIAETGAVKDIERTRREAAKPDGFIEITPGRRFDIDKDDPNQTDVFMLQLARDEIQGTGITREFAGQEDKVLSGRAIALRQTEGSKMVRPFFAALRSTRKDLFEFVLEEMQQYWTGEKLVKITDDPESGSIALNQRKIDQFGNPYIANNLRLGKYDIKIDEDVESPNQRQEIFNQLAQLGQMALQAGQAFPMDMLIKSSDLPNKKEWLDSIALQKQEQAKLQQQQMQMMQLQALAKSGGAGQTGRA